MPKTASPAILEMALAAELGDRRFLAAIASSLPWERWAGDCGYEHFQVIRAVAMMERLGHLDDKRIRDELEISEVDLLQIRNTLVYEGLRGEISRLLAQRDDPVEVSEVIRGEAPKLVRDMIVTARLSPDDELRNRVTADLLDREYPKKGREPKAPVQRVVMLPERVIAALQAASADEGRLIEVGEEGGDS